jgi:hypothetical protein
MQQAPYHVGFAGSFLRVVCWFALALVLFACGGGESADTQARPPSGGNVAPTIAGSPAGAIVQGQSYNFAPTADDADGDALTFSIVNQPGWASFNPATGVLSGIPDQADVGTYANIRINVSDGEASASLSPFTIDVLGTATGVATLSWVAPTENSAGEPLEDLAGYKIYWGQSEGSYTNSVTIDNPGVTTFVMDQLAPATWYFVATAFDSQGVESHFSNVASKVVL